MIGTVRTLALGLALGGVLIAASWSWGRHRVALECETAAVESAREEAIRELVGVGYMGEFGVPEGTAREYWRAIRRHCHHESYLVLALIAVESRFDPDATSSKGYRGLLQTQPYVPYPAVQIAHGCAVLEEMIERTNGDLARAVSQYQGGSRLDNHRVLAEYARIANKTRGGDGNVARRPRRPRRRRNAGEEVCDRDRGSDGNAGPET